MLTILSSLDLEWEVRLRASGQLPSIGARASYEDGLGRQPVIIVLGLDIGEGDEEKQWCAKAKQVHR